MRTDTITVMNHLNVFMFHESLETVSRWESEGKGKAKRKNHKITAFTLNPPEALPSDSTEDPAAISKYEMLVNAEAEGTRGYQRFVQQKVRNFGNRFEKNHLVSAPSWAYRGKRLGYGITVTA